MIRNRHLILRSNGRRGMTLVEVMLAVPISALFAILTITVLATAAVIFKNITDETRFREQTTRALTLLEKDMRNSESATIATTYTATPSAATYNGDCVYIVNKNRPVGEQNLAYYYFKANGWNWGNLYLDTDTASAPNPNTDKIVARHLTAFEARRNPAGLGSEYRLAMRGDLKEQRFMGNATAAGNKLVMSTTIRPRHN